MYKEISVPAEFHINKNVVKILLWKITNIPSTLNGFRNFDTECKDGADTLKLNFILGVAPFSFLCHSTLHFLQ